MLLAILTSVVDAKLNENCAMTSFDYQYLKRQEAVVN